MNNVMEYEILGLVEYREALNIQNSLVVRRMSGEIGDRMLILEHPPVITQGKRECAEDFLSSHDEIHAEGIDIVRIDRGGKLTYHGPGQLIGYFICDVKHAGGVREFVRAIEELLIRTLGDFGIQAGRDSEHPGVWVGRDKIAAVGLHVSHDISSHGFALNVNCDLSPYRHIVACGISGRGITTMAQHVGDEVRIDIITQTLLSHAGDVFGRLIRPCRREQM